MGDYQAERRAERRKRDPEGALKPERVQKRPAPAEETLKPERVQRGERARARDYDQSPEPSDRSPAG